MRFLVTIERGDRKPVTADEVQESLEFEFGADMGIATVTVEELPESGPEARGAGAGSDSER